MASGLEALQPFLSATWADRDALVAQVAAEVIAEVPSYARTPSSEVWIGMTRILARIVEGDPFSAPTEEDLDAAVGTAIQGARAGITVEDLVAAILLGAREVEGAVMDRAAAAGVGPDILLDGCRRARRWAEDVAVAAARALMSSGGPAASDPAADLIHAVRRHAAPLELNALLSMTGLDPSATFVVAVARTVRGGPLDPVEATRLRFANPRAAWLQEDDVLTGVLATDPAASGALVLGTARAESVDDLPTAWAAADRASRTASALAGPGCHDLESLGLLATVHEDTALQRRLMRRWIEPLLAEPRHDLLKTVRLWQRASQVELVAQELKVHPNTVRNRLARVDALLPGWREPQAQAELWAALVAHSALDD